MPGTESLDDGDDCPSQFPAMLRTWPGPLEGTVRYSGDCTKPGLETTRMASHPPGVGRATPQLSMTTKQASGSQIRPGIR